MNQATLTLARTSEPRLVQLAEEIAFLTVPGDLITLSGDLGAGKTTFARGMIRALLGHEQEEIPSPTYTLVQSYDAERIKVSHFDLYRLGDPTELEELGLDHALAVGIAVVEWPERGEDALPNERLEISLSDCAEELASATDLRDLTLTGYGSWARRIERLESLRAVCDNAGWHGEDVHVYYLQGDASARRYARLTKPDGEQAIIMDWPRQPDGPAIRNGLAYSQIAHLAEDVRPFVAIADMLRANGLSTPKIFAADLEQGLLVCEHLGNSVFGAELENCNAEDRAKKQGILWQSATDVLIALRRIAVPNRLTVNGGNDYALPTFDQPAFAVETELLVDWYWPLVHQHDCPEDVAGQFHKLWANIADEALKDSSHWLLRDYHSPNLIWMPDRAGIGNVGVIDFQDAVLGPAAYDLVSLLQDARIDVPSALEDHLLGHYCDAVSKAEPDFDAKRFAFHYHALGAQRATKILGIFARLKKRDGKPQYLAHIPRIWRYLERNLRHPDLVDMKHWFDSSFPPDVRSHPPESNNR